MSLYIPIVLIIYNRPHLTKSVFRKIAEVKPIMLFVIADGPKHADEKVVCYQARQIIDEINWECEIKTNYSDINLGCRRRISSGLDWVFSEVEEAIILEDDCLPNPSFFTFCQALLDYYRHDERIWMISGNNFQNGQWRGDGSYYFSCYPHCWGWATWKRAWKNYDSNLNTWPKFKESNLLKSIFNNSIEIKYWTNVFDKLVETGQPDSWAYRWAYSCWTNSALTVLPNVNLVSNIGFGEKSTHTNNSEHPLANLPSNSILSLKHPSFLVRDIVADDYTFENVFKSPYTKNRSLKTKIIKGIKNLINIY